MQVIIVSTSDEVGHFAAAKIAQVVRNQPDCVLGVATGSSPLATYRHLSIRVRDGSLDCSKASAFALDEYVGLPPSHPAGYRRVIQREVVEPLGMDPARVHAPDGFATDLQHAGEEYERQIREAGGIDIQLLGIGANGHIGFNEPASSFASRTRLKTLAPQTRVDNSRFFEHPDQVPRHCLTQGLGTILDARELLLVADGTAKAQSIARMIEGPVTSMCPGSALQLHPHATVVVDEAAAAELQLADYYRYTAGHLPDWQRVSSAD